jgi:glycosyltransferase involved in cell wall biosynthesis
VNIKDQRIKVGFLSTYPPRECGIATFTQDLVKELKQQKQLKAGILAVSDRKYNYGGDVIAELPQQSREKYAEAAEQINRSDIQVLAIEHEYGIYGGDCGEYLLDLLGRVEKPVVTTLHTVLPNPNEKQKNILRALGGKSRKIVTMASNSRAILHDIYGIPLKKVTVIPHGVPEFDLPSREVLKKESHLEGRTVVSTFGLISPGKGLEYGIEAIAGNREKSIPTFCIWFSDKRTRSSRGSLGKRTAKASKSSWTTSACGGNVRFVDRYLSKEELVRYLKLSDVYMTPYLSKDQAVSGTLAYAVGYGRAIVSTPYLYAQEMLADGRGMLAKFRDAGSLSGCMNRIIEHPEQKKSMEQKTQQLGRGMTWKRVAEKYAETFLSAFHSDPVRDDRNG